MPCAHHIMRDSIYAISLPPARTSDAKGTEMEPAGRRVQAVVTKGHREDRNGGSRLQVSYACRVPKLRHDARMTSAGIPDDLVDLLTTDRVGHVASIRPDGSIAIHITWIDYDGEYVLTSSRVGSRKGRNWRRNPQAAVSVVDRDDAWRFLQIRGRVTDIRPDIGLAFIDKLSRRYLGRDYDRRDSEREIFVITIDHLRASRGRR